MSVIQCLCRSSLLLLVFGLDPAKCLAAAPSSTSSSGCSSSSSASFNKVQRQNGDRLPKLVSIQKNGGHAKIFSFNDDDDDETGGERTTSPTEDPSRQQLPQTKRRTTTRRKFQNLQSILPAIQSAIRSTFLPSGYPTKTPDGYLQYSCWSWIQDLSTQLRSVLATQRVLEGVGVGREGATALSALMNFLVRDGCGMAATLLFTSGASSQFRTDVKRWRLFADLMVDIGITLEVAAIIVPPVFFLPMISVGNMCKAICGVAAGACGGSINLHWARGSDISDINAKFGAQHTVTGALGLIFAAYFAKSVSHVQPLHLWILYSTLTLIHVYANMRCMRLIAFDSFNNWRMNRVLAEFLEWWTPKTKVPGEAKNSTNTVTNSQKDDGGVALSSPMDIAQIEPLFFGLSRLQRPQKQRQFLSQTVPIYFGESFNQFSEHTHKNIHDLWVDTEKMVLQGQDKEEKEEDRYLISSGWINSSGRGGGEEQRRRPCVSVVFGTGTTPLVEAKAYVHAQLLSRRLEEKAPSLESTASSSSSRMDSNQDVSNTNSEGFQPVAWVEEAEAMAQIDINLVWDMFQNSCHEKGWDLSKTELRTLGYEVEIAAP